MMLEAAEVHAEPVRLPGQLADLDGLIIPGGESTAIAKLMETSFTQSLVMSKGSPLIFFTRPISAVLIGIALISLFAPLLRGVMDWRKKVVEIS